MYFSRCFSRVYSRQLVCHALRLKFLTVDTHNGRRVNGRELQFSNHIPGSILRILYRRLELVSAVRGRAFNPRRAFNRRDMGNYFRGSAGVSKTVYIRLASRRNSRNPLIPATLSLYECPRSSGWLKSHIKISAESTEIHVPIAIERLTIKREMELPRICEKITLLFRSWQHDGFTREIDIVRKLLRRYTANSREASRALHT